MMHLAFQGVTRRLLALMEKDMQAVWQGEVMAKVDGVGIVIFQIIGVVVSFVSFV